MTERVGHDWRARLEAARLERAALVAAVEAAVAVGVLEFGAHGRPGQYAVLSRDPSEPGAWRFTTYDEAGFSGHATRSTQAAAVREMVEGGYAMPAAGTLDTLAAGDAWARGMKAAEAVRRENAARRL